MKWNYMNNISLLLFQSGCSGFDPSLLEAIRHCKLHSGFLALRRGSVDDILRNHGSPWKPPRHPNLPEVRIVYFQKQYHIYIFPSPRLLRFVVRYLFAWIFYNFKFSSHAKNTAISDNEKQPSFPVITQSWQIWCFCV